MGVLVIMLRSLAVAALTLAGSGIACAQSVYLYVAPGASVYVAPSPNGPYYNGAPAVYPGFYPQEPYAPPPVVAAPLPASFYGAEVAPEPYQASGPGYYAPQTYGAPLQAYGAAPGLVMQRRLYVNQAPRPQAPVSSGRRGTVRAITR
jgi:hypothetical protein